ncbi:hypothetical protein [Nocardioides sp.]|uniref:hypothetical protein n=1 Tax=Nocardioides sp. TaxID=35761 RepID=UPI002602C8BD|nr:hypothetical protein [Nocardioides sp.]MDI6911460.1 hypothetical protein [Nocardioides sp.]
MSEIRAWITSTGSEALTAGELKAYLEHVPDAASMCDGSDAALTSVEAVWEVSSE